MFERFTDAARRTVVMSQDEARGLRHNYIGTEHLLLGILRIRDESGDPVLAMPLQGCSLDEVRRRVESIVGRGAEDPTGHIPFTPRAKSVLAHSLHESRALGHHYIGAGHVLLGLLDEPDGVGAQILTALDVDSGTVRRTVTSLLPTDEAEPAPPVAEHTARNLELRARVWELEQQVARLTAEIAELRKLLGHPGTDGSA